LSGGISFAAFEGQFGDAGFVEFAQTGLNHAVRLLFYGVALV
jgi:hypothetical protein